MDKPRLHLLVVDTKAEAFFACRAVSIRDRVSQEGLLLPSPLRTVRATFIAYRSSTLNAYGQRSSGNFFTSMMPLHVTDRM